MEYRTLGKTGLSVSALSYGASPLGGVFGDVNEDEGIRAVHFAIDSGINLFDVSPYYGITKAESALGKALKGYRDRIILATKAGRFGADEFDFSKKAMKRSIDESLKRLQTDYVDILQAHDIEFGERARVVDETYEALLEIRDEGKCRFIGMTGYPMDVLVDAIETCDLDVTLSYSHFCLYNPLMLTKLMPVTERRGVGLINASATGMGLLTDKVLTGLPEWHPAPPILVETCQKAVHHCRQHGVDPVDLAMQYVYWDDRVPTTLVGMSKQKHVEGNLRAVEKQADSQLLADVLEILKPVKDAVWPSGIRGN